MVFTDVVFDLIVLTEDNSVSALKNLRHPNRCQEGRNAKKKGSFAASWFFMETDESEKGSLSLFPNGPVFAVFFNQTDGHWTMTGYVKLF